MNLTDIKAALIEAHRAKNWELAKLLSQQKAVALKRVKRVCVDCGVKLATRSGTGAPMERCAMHARTRRYYGHTIANV